MTTRVLADAVDLGIPETERGRETGGSFAVRRGLPATDFGGDLHRPGPVAGGPGHWRDFAGRASLGLKVPRALVGRDLVVSLLLRRYRDGAPASAPAPLRLGLADLIATRDLGTVDVPVDDRWRLRELPIPGGAAGRTLRLEFDDSANVGDGGHYGISLASVRLAAADPGTTRAAEVVDWLDYGLPESEAGRYAIGTWASPERDARNRFGGPEFLGGDLPLRHTRETAFWSAAQLRVPPEHSGQTLLVELTAMTYLMGGPCALGPTRLFLFQHDHAWFVGEFTAPPGSGWHVARFEVTPDRITSDPLFLVVDQQSAYGGDASHHGHGLASAAVYVAEDRPAARPEARPARPSAATAPDTAPDVVLVNCPVWDFRMPPIGPATIASFLRAHGVRVRVIDFNIEAFRAVPASLKFLWDGFNAPRWNESGFVNAALQGLEHYIQGVAERILRLAPEFVGFSVATVNAAVSRRLAEVLKERRPEIKIIFGGPGIPFFPSEMLGPAWDHLVLGAGEYPFLHAVRGRSGRLQGLVSRNGSPGSTPPAFQNRARIPDINRMPLLDFAGFDLSPYDHPWRMPVLTSRGCINACKYCFDHVYYGPFSAMTGERAYEQLVHLNRLHGRRRFEFSDLLCNGDLGALAEMCERLVRGGHDFFWGSFAVIRQGMTPDLLALARRAGCRHLHYGFESGSERMLDLMGRDYSPAQAREVLAATKAAGIETRINLMVGFPGETDETVGETIAFVRENAGIIDLVDTVNPVYLMAMSDLYEHRGEYGIETPDEIPDNWVDGRLDQPTRENWVLRVIHELRAAGVRNNLGVSRSFQCSSGDTVR